MNIEQLRARFVRIALCALAGAMVLVTLVINGVNWYLTDQELRETVTAIAQSGGRFAEDYGKRRGEGMGWRGSREAAYEARYFMVRRSQAGDFKAGNMDNIASVDEAEAVALAKTAWATGKAYGYIGQYAYLTQAASGRGGGVGGVTFLDCQTRLNGLTSLAVVSGAACAAGIVLALLLVALLSRRAVKPYVENEEKQRRFITDAGHELKTPLTVISANMDILSQNVGEDEWITGTRRQVGTLKRLVEELTTLSKIDEQAPEARALFDLSAAVRETAEGFEAVSGLENKRLIAQIEPGLFLTGDEAALRRLAGILLDNAFKYAPEDSDIRLRLLAEGRKLSLTCENALGQPMDEAALPRLFDRFYRFDPARAKETGQGGYGLGLSIARAIVQKHGGKIEASLLPENRILLRATLPKK